MLLRPWQNKEIDILPQFRNRNRYPFLSQDALAKAGFMRSLEDIDNKRTDMA